MKEKLSIGEAAKRAGVSVRTLRHYDAIGLLRPCEVTQAGYRLYGEREMRRLAQILFYRELEFPLEDIARMIDTGDEAQALRRHLSLLRAKRRRLDAQIARLETMTDAETGEEQGMKEYEEMKQEYAAEVRDRWGGTAAYAQSEEKRARRAKADQAKVMEEMNALMAQFAAVRDLPPDDARVQELVVRWRGHISAHYYDCTDEILAGLAQMYVCDERFKKNIDCHGEGTAQCMARAIAAALGKEAY